MVAKRSTYFLFLLLLPSIGFGQTAVTTSGSVTGAIPVFTGTATLGNSVITQQNSNIGIGTSTPAALFSVGSSSQFQINSAGLLSSTGGVNLVSYLGNSAVSYPGVNSVVVFQPSLTANSTLGAYASNNLLSSAMTGAFTNSSQYFGVQVNHYKQTAGAGTQTAASVGSNFFELGGGSTSYGTIMVDSAAADLYSTSANVTNLSLFNGTMSWNGGGYTGTVTNLYGLYLGNMSGATNNYAIYSAGGQSYFAGNVGLGTATPLHTLDVNGQANATSYCIGGTNCITSWQSGPQGPIGPQGPSGPAGATGPAGASPFGLSGTNAYYNSGNVGIGTTAPSATLEVNGTTRFDNSAIAYGQAGFVSNYSTNDGATPFKSINGSNYAQLGQMGSSGFGIANWANSAVLEGTDHLTLDSYAGNLYFQANRVTGMTLLQGGNIGIGTTSPRAKLEVDGAVMLTAGSGAAITFQDGTVQSTAWNGVLGGGDYAESVDVIGDRTQYEPGDVLVIDPSSKGKFMKSAGTYSTAVMGIYSTRPGVVGRRQLSDRSHMNEEVPMAMVGVVPTKVSAENGKIEPGDLLVTSSTRGYAMKGTDRAQLAGAIIGKALEPLETGLGVIEVAVSIQ